MKIKRDEELNKFNSNKKLLNQNKKFKIKMSYGLHMGEAYEGYIGSQFKIDSAFLSGQISTVKKLQDLSKVYGVDIVIGEPLYRLFSDEVKFFCRKIDKIKYNLTEQIMNIYTCSFDDGAVEMVKKNNQNMSYFQKKK